MRILTCFVKIRATVLKPPRTRMFGKIKSVSIWVVGGPLIIKGHDLMEEQ